MNDSAKSITGGCLCGAVTYEIKGDPMMVIQCHCLNCQKSTGAGHMPFAGFQDSQVSVKGKTKTYSCKVDSGATASSHFCPECGSRVFGTTTSFPGMMGVPLGTMDDSSAFEPGMKVYMKRLRKWDRDLKNVPAFDAMPPMQG